MSGGSFDYMYRQDTDTLMGGSFQEQLEDMRDTLRELGADDAAEQTEMVLAVIREAEERIELHRAALDDVWHAVEWERSGDFREDQVHRVLERYRCPGCRRESRHAKRPRCPIHDKDKP